MPKYNDEQRWRMVRVARAMTGENKTEFAKRIGAAPQTLSAWELERKSVGDDYFKKIRRIHDAYVDRGVEVPDPKPGIKNFLVLDRVGKAWVVASRHECADDAYTRLNGDTYVGTELETTIAQVPEEIPLNRRLPDARLRRIGASRVSRDGDDYRYEDF